MLLQRDRQSVDGFSEAVLKPANHPRSALWLALGIAASILYAPTGADPVDSQCLKPHQPIGTDQNQVVLADTESDNPLLACLGSLRPACRDMGGPSGMELCLDYDSATVSEVNGKTLICTVYHRQRQ